MMTPGEQVIAISLFLNLVLTKIKGVSAQETQCLRIGNNILWISCNNDDNSRALKQWLTENELTSVHDILEIISDTDLSQLNQNRVLRSRDTTKPRPTKFKALSTLSTLANIVNDDFEDIYEFRVIEDIPGSIIEHKIKKNTSKVPLSSIVIITGNPPVETGVKEVHAEQKLIYSYSIGSEHGTNGDVYLGGCKPPCGSCLKPVVYAVSRLGIKYSSTNKIRRPRWDDRQVNSGTMAIDAFSFDKFWNVNKDYWDENITKLANASQEQ